MNPLALTLALALAAPAPFPARAARTLTPADMVGSWTMVWAGHQWATTLAANGDYSCQGTGMVFVGSWSLGRDGTLWITESARPSDALSWRTYSVRLCPVTMRGRMEEGSPGTEVYFSRRR